MKFIFSIFLLLICTSLFSQDTLQHKKEKINFPKYTVGVGLTSMMNTYNSVSIRQDYSFYKNFRVFLESSYIFGSIYNYSSGNVNGYRLKAGLNVRFAGNERNLAYLGVNGVLRHTFSEREIIVRYEDANFSERVNFEQERLLRGLEIRVGMLSRVSERFTFNLALGLGPAVFEPLNIVFEPSIPELVDLSFAQIFFREPVRKGAVVIGSFNVTLSYIIFN